MTPILAAVGSFVYLWTFNGEVTNVSPREGTTAWKLCVKRELEWYRAQTILELSCITPNNAAEKIGKLERKWGKKIILAVPQE